MSAARLDTKIDLPSLEAVACGAHIRMLAQRLRADVAKAAPGGYWLKDDEGE